MCIIYITNGKNTIDKIHSPLSADQIFESRHANRHNKIIKMKSFIIK